LLSKHDRLLRLEKTHREQVIELNDEQIRQLERFSPEFRECQIEVHYRWWLIPSSSARSGCWQGVSVNRVGLLGGTNALQHVQEGSEIDTEGSAH